MLELLIESLNDSEAFIEFVQYVGFDTANKLIDSLESPHKEKAKKYGNLARVTHAYGDRTVHGLAYYREEPLCIWVYWDNGSKDLQCPGHLILLASVLK